MWPTPWRSFQRKRLEDAAQFMVIWKAEPLINNSVMAGDGVPAEATEMVRTILFWLESTEGVRDELSGMKSAGFLHAIDSDYDYRSLPKGSRHPHSWGCWNRHLLIRRTVIFSLVQYRPLRLLCCSQNRAANTPMARCQARESAYRARYLLHNFSPRLRAFHVFIDLQGIS
jgi:hypothetical protein